MGKNKDHKNVCISAWTTNFEDGFLEGRKGTSAKSWSLKDFTSCFHTHIYKNPAMQELRYNLRHKITQGLPQASHLRIFKSDA